MFNPFELKPVGRCQVCKNDIFSGEYNVLRMYHRKCLTVVKDRKYSIKYKIPTTGGFIRIKK